MQATNEDLPAPICPTTAVRLSVLTLRFTFFRNGSSSLDHAKLPSLIEMEYDASREAGRLLTFSALSSSLHRNFVKRPIDTLDYKTKRLPNEADNNTNFWKRAPTWMRRVTADGSIVSGWRKMFNKASPTKALSASRTFSGEIST